MPHGHLVMTNGEEVVDEIVEDVPIAVDDEAEEVESIAEMEMGGGALVPEEEEADFPEAAKAQEQDTVEHVVDDGGDSDDEYENDEDAYENEDFEASTVQAEVASPKSLASISYNDEDFEDTRVPSVGSPSQDDDSRFDDATETLPVSNDIGTQRELEGNGEETSNDDVMKVSHQKNEPEEHELKVEDEEMKTVVEDAEALGEDHHVAAVEEPVQQQNEAGDVNDEVKLDEEEAREEDAVEMKEQRHEDEDFTPLVSHDEGRSSTVETSPGTAATPSSPKVKEAKVVLLPCTYPTETNQNEPRSPSSWVKDSAQVEATSGTEDDLLFASEEEGVLPEPSEPNDAATKEADILTVVSPVTIEEPKLSETETYSDGLQKIDANEYESKVDAIAVPSASISVEGEPQGEEQNNVQMEPLQRQDDEEAEDEEEYVGSSYGMKVVTPEARVEDELEPLIGQKNDLATDEKVLDEKVPDEKVPDEKVPGEKVPDEKVPDDADLESVSQEAVTDAIRRADAGALTTLTSQSSTLSLRSSSNEQQRRRGKGKARGKGKRRALQTNFISPYTVCLSKSGKAKRAKAKLSDDDTEPTSALSPTSADGPTRTTGNRRWLTPLADAPRLNDYDAPLIQMSPNSSSGGKTAGMHGGDGRESEGQVVATNIHDEDDPEVLHARVEEMRQSVAFIKDRFHALKQISMLDPKVALEGGWTSVAIEEELVKLKKELAEERAQLKHALDSAGQLNLNRARSAVAFDPNVSISSLASESRSKLYSDDVANRLEALCKELGKHCKAHDLELKRRKLGKLPTKPSRRSPSLPERLRPRNVTIKPLRASRRRAGRRSR